jgi:hypothetical protein
MLLAAGTKTNLECNANISFLKCRKVSLGLGGKRCSFPRNNSIRDSIILNIIKICFHVLSALLSAFSQRHHFTEKSLIDSDI